MGERKAGVNHCTSEQLATSFTEHSVSGRLTPRTDE